MILLLPWIPFLASVLVLLTPREAEERLRTLAIGACSLCFLLVLSLFLRFQPGLEGYQFLHRYSWLPALGINYQVGLDGINMTLLLLHALVSLAGAVVSAWHKERLKEYLFFYLILVGSIFGVFTALDLFLLYLFYEMTLIPLYPMIAVWGSKNKEYGAMKLTLFITAGALLALFGILVLYKKLGMQSFDLIELQEVVRTVTLSGKSAKILSGFFLLGFGVIASLWPVHSWSPIGYAVAPTSVSMLHAGVLKKMGPYLILRLAVALLPEGVKFWSDLLALLAVIGILYAGYAAMTQTDLKFVIGFSSVSHMGYVILALAALTTTSISGMVLLMFSHGVMAAAAFAVIGFLYEQAHRRGLSDFGGIAKQVPFISTVFVMVSLASLGLPGFSNFVAELLVFIGSWARYPLHVGLAVFGILITAVYLLRMVKQVCFGPANPNLEGLKDAKRWSEKFPFVLLLGALLLFGFWPQALLRIIRPSVEALLR